MKQLTDEQLDHIWHNSNPSNFEFKSAAHAVIAEFCKINGLTGEAQPAEQAKGQEAVAEAEKLADWVALLNEASRIVQHKPTWNRFIDGTPLQNDIAVWMADFARAYVLSAIDVLKPITTPPAQPAREWVGLTGSDVIQLMPDDSRDLTMGQLVDYGRAIESKLREKNAGQTSDKANVEAAILAEREACAQVCDMLGEEMDNPKDGVFINHPPSHCATAIRARSDK